MLWSPKIVCRQPLKLGLENDLEMSWKSRIRSDHFFKMRSDLRSSFDQMILILSQIIMEKVFWQYSDKVWTFDIKYSTCVYFNSVFFWYYRLSGIVVWSYPVTWLLSLYSFIFILLSLFFMLSSFLHMFSKCKLFCLSMCHCVLQ